MPVPRDAKIEVVSHATPPSDMTPEDFFVLSRVDGRLSAGEVIAVTGLGGGAVRALERLFARGMIRVAEDAARKAATRDQAAARKRAALESTLGAASERARTRGDTGSHPPAADAGPIPSQPRARGVTGAPPAAPEPPAPEWMPPSADAHDPRLRSDLPVPVQVQRRALWIVDHSEYADAFDVLGVPLSADGTRVKRAFHDASRRLHPDTYYKHALGDLRGVLERAFHLLRAAYEQLKDEAARDELALAIARQSPERAATHARRVPESATTDATAVDAPPRAADEAAAPVAAQAAFAPAADPAAERERRLRDEARRATANRRVGEAVFDAARRKRSDQAGEHVAAGDDALAEGRHGAAAAAYRLALELAPDDAGIKAKLAQATAGVRLSRFHTANARARAFASQSRFAEAAEALGEAAEALPGVESLSLAGEALRDFDPARAHRYAMASLEALSQSKDGNDPTIAGNVHVRAGKVFLANGQRHTAEHEHRLASKLLGATHPEVKALGAALRGG